MLLQEKGLRKRGKRQAKVMKSGGGAAVGKGTDCLGEEKKGKRRRKAYKTGTSSQSSEDRHLLPVIKIERKKILGCINKNVVCETQEVIILLY